MSPASGDGGEKRRKFTVEYKQRILAELDDAGERGTRSAVLDREGLLWSHVAKWRRQREVGMLEDSWMDLSSPARLLQLAQERDALLEEIDRLRSENSTLRREAGGEPLPQRVRRRLNELLGRGSTSDAPGDDADDQL